MGLWISFGAKAKANGFFLGVVEGCFIGSIPSLMVMCLGKYGFSRICFCVEWRVRGHCNSGIWVSGVKAVAKRGGLRRKWPCQGGLV